MSKFTVNEVAVLSVCFYYIHYGATTCGLFIPNCYCMKTRWYWIYR